MLIYFIVAISFALSSLFFIHRRAFGMFNLPTSITKDIIYVLLVTLSFPAIFLAWILDSEKFIKTYGEAYGSLEEGD